MKPHTPSVRFWSILTVLIVICSLALSACGASPQQSAPAPTQSGNIAPPPTSVPATAADAAPLATKRTRLIFFGNLEPASIDVVTMSGNVNERQVAAQIFETLVYMDQSQQIYPGLAREWKRSEDATVWTFTIASGVTWHDGTPFTAQSVVDYFEYVRDNPVGSGPGALKAVIDSARAIDETTVELTLTAPRPDLLIELADPGMGIGYANYLKRVGADAGFNPIGTGPFKFKEWVRGSQIVLVRNPEWTWGSPMFR